MSPSRINRQLRREITSHPGKAAILGLLFLVALWFWVPLVWGWVDEDQPAAKPTAVAQTDNSAPKAAASNTPNTPNTPKTSNTALKKVESPKYPWHQLVQWMENDLRTSATNPLRGRDDPLLSPQAEVATAEVEEEPQETAPEATPEDLGMVLSSTIIGPRSRVARVNGKSYRQGEAVKLLRDGQQIEFTLVAVYPRRVVLKRQGGQFELKIPSPVSSGRIELSRDGN